MPSGLLLLDATVRPGKILIEKYLAGPFPDGHAAASRPARSQR
jgi:hypothetical protein